VSRKLGETSDRAKAREDRRAGRRRTAPLTIGDVLLADSAFIVAQIADDGLWRIGDRVTVLEERPFAPRAWSRPMVFDDMAQRIIAEVRPYSMVPDDSLALTVQLTLEAIDADLPGDLVECGTWKGGSSFAMLLAQRYRYGRIVKPVWMFDSFAGLPAVDERDGPLALKYQSEPDQPGYHDNCTAPLDQVMATCREFAFSPEEAMIVPGWFDQTFPQRKAELASRRCAVLRVDCDWYEPVRYVLDEFAPLVVEDGVIILDDYYHWDGCALATHDFLSANRLCYRIRSLPTFHCAWMVKQAHRRA
jgi:hypothetical protein